MKLAQGHFVRELDFDPAQWQGLVELSGELKAELRAGSRPLRLAGQNYALIFEKTSTRTRAAFEVAARQEGAGTTYLDPVSSQFGHKESVKDSARVLGRMFDALVFRGTKQSDLEQLAEFAGVPVINALTDDWHPTQMLADALTIDEHVAKPLNEVAHTFIGDGRFNMGRSFLISSALLGMDTRLICPAGYAPEPELIEQATALASRTGGQVTVTDDLDAVVGSDAVSTDVWVSMGEAPEVWEERIRDLSPYRVDKKLMDHAGSDSIFLHCLPAFHDTETTVGKNIYDQFGLTEMEVTDEVFESSRSVVFDQAENRLHTIKAVLVTLLS